MEVHTFRANSLQEALQQVRQSLGPDASVLQTRERRQSRLGIFSKKLVEVEATCDVVVASRFATSRGAPQANVPARSPSTNASAARATTAGRRLENASQQSPPAKATATTTKPAARHLSPAAPDLPPVSQDSMGLPPAMLEVLSDLLDGGVEPQIARELLRETHESCGQAQLQDPWLIRGRLSQIIASKLRVSGSIELREHEQQVIALVGPTGVGKTTTLAKIAAGFRFDLGCKIGLITLDTFRLGAVDQLLQYAELISAPLEVVSSPDQVTAALQRLRECDLVLLDSAGRAPRDAEQLLVLREFLQCAQPHATQLVVSATSSTEYVADAVRQFSMLGPTHLLITKLDEAVHFGGWLSFLKDNRLPISYLTTGQHVPQDIAVASSRRLASLLLGSIYPPKGQVSEGQPV